MESRVLRRQKVPLKDATPSQGRTMEDESEPLYHAHENDDDLIGEDIMTSNHSMSIHLSPDRKSDGTSYLQDEHGELSPLADPPTQYPEDISLSSSEPSLFPPSPPRLSSRSARTGMARINNPAGGDIDNANGRSTSSNVSTNIPQDTTTIFSYNPGGNGNGRAKTLSDADLDAIQNDLDLIQSQFAPITRRDTDLSYASSVSVDTDINTDSNTKNTDTNVDLNANVNANAKKEQKITSTVRMADPPSTLVSDKDLDAIQNDLDVIQNSFVPLTRRDTDRSFASSVVSDSDMDDGGSRSSFPRLRRRKRTNTFTDEEIKNIPRLVHRNLPFKQSRQEIAVVNKTIFRSLKLQRILYMDWYHVFLRQPTLMSIAMMLVFWTCLIIMFAFIYMHVDRRSPDADCGLGQAGEAIKFPTAFAFSLETCTTVGYGLPNSTNGFFETECGSLQVAIYFQMICSMLFNAFLFSFVFARLARCESRGAQVLFSDKAIVEKRDGKWMMHVRIYDFDSSQPVVEAHVRMYCVSWRDYERQTRDLVQPHLLHVMRILQPNDDLGATMFTSIPANVTHRIDAFSPLAPIRYRRRMKMLGVGGTSGLSLREVDQDVGARSGVVCPACGETFGTMFHLRRHIQYTQMVENSDESFPMVGSHRDNTIITPDLFKPLMLSEEDIREQLRDKEIMVVVEGIEPMVSGTFQALQSYKLNDIVFGGRFAPCMTQTGGKIYVDVDKFHQILPPTDASIHRYSLYRKPGQESSNRLGSFFGGEKSSLRSAAEVAGRPPLCVGRRP